MADQLLSPAEAAEIAGCHKDTVRRAAIFGLLKSQKVGRAYAISLEHLQEWIAAGMPNHRRKSTRKAKNIDPSVDDNNRSEEP